jgi:hypothetical protein
VAVLEIDELKSRVVRQLRCLYEEHRDLFEFIIRQDVDAVRKTSIELRVRVGYTRFRDTLPRTRKAARMCELQPEVEIRVCVRTESGGVFFDERVSQVRQRSLRTLLEHELVRIRTAFIADGDRFPTPNQFGAALSEVFPPSYREVARLAIECAVPSFHRKNAEPVADGDGVNVEGSRKWRRSGRREHIVELKRDAAGVEMPPQRVGRFERSHPWVTRFISQCRPRSFNRLTR